MTRYYILSTLPPSQTMEGGNFDIVTAGLSPNMRIHRHETNTSGQVYYSISPWSDSELEADNDALEVPGYEWDYAIEILNDEIRNL